MTPLSRIVEIEWIDPHSVSDGTWVSPADIDDVPRSCRSVGYVLRESAVSLTLVAAQAIGADGEVSQVGDGVVLPRSAIVRMTGLTQEHLEVINAA